MILKRIESIHEQRETHRWKDSCAVRKGHWIEVVDFDRKTEQVTIKDRMEITKIKTEPLPNGKERLIVTCKRLDFNGQRAKANELAEQVLTKHGEMLKASLIKCYVEGLSKEDFHCLNNIARKVDTEALLSNKMGVFKDG